MPRSLATAAVVAGAIVATVLPATSAHAAGARTIYVSLTGDDAADGLSPTSAWRSLDAVSAAVLGPGDTVLLEGGSRFAGSIYLDSADGGAAEAPVVIGSYGDGRATVVPAGTAGVLAYNTGGVLVRDLVVAGATAAERSKDGISFYNDLPGNVRLAGVTISGVDVSGFKAGIAIGGGRGASGFRAVTVTASRLHHNVEAGLITYGPAFVATRPTYAHESVIVSGVTAHTNLGDPANRVRNTGSGIVLGSVYGGRVVSSTAYGNGALCAAPEGPAGIWAYDATRVVIEKSTSYRNRTAKVDGDGFDLDQNVSHSVLQWNRSWDNDGAGYLVYTAQANGANTGNVVRSNTSTNDARRSSWYGALAVAGRVSGLQVYSNTFSVTATGPYRPPVVRIGAGVTGMRMWSNRLTSLWRGPLVVGRSG